MRTPLLRTPCPRPGIHYRPRPGRPSSFPGGWHSGGGRFPERRNVDFIYLFLLRTPQVHRKAHPAGCAAGSRVGSLGADPTVATTALRRDIHVADRHRGGLPLRSRQARRGVGWRHPHLIALGHGLLRLPAQRGRQTLEASRVSFYLPSMTASMIDNHSLGGGRMLRARLPRLPRVPLLAPVWPRSRT